MSVYDRAVSSVSLEKKQELFNIYIAKAAEFFGVTKTRDIYEQAIDEGHHVQRGASCRACCGACWS